MDYETIKTLPLPLRKKLIDYVEGMPNNISSYVKTNMNQTFMNPEIYKGTVSLHNTSTLKKYIDKKRLGEDVRSPESASYQKEFCTIMDKIHATRQFTPSIKQKLSSLMMMDCYDASSMIKVEIELGNLIEDTYATNNRACTMLVEMINEYIIPYKLRVYDLYAYLSMDQELGLEETNHMVQLNHAINTTIAELDAYPRDVAVLMYVYAKELGAEKLFQKYHILNRFIFSILQIHNEEYVSKLNTTVSELVNLEYSIGRALSMLVYPQKYTFLFSSRDKGLSGEKAVDGTHNISEDSYVFFMNHIDHLRGNEAAITQNLKALTGERILADSTLQVPSDHISFSLSDNEYGHLLHLSGMDSFGTAYSATNGIRFLGKYKGDFYIFFKVITKPNSLFGLSILPVNNGKDRKLMTVAVSKRNYYSYINTI